MNTHEKRDNETPIHLTAEAWRKLRTIADAWKMTPAEALAVLVEREYGRVVGAGS